MAALRPNRMMRAALHACAYLALSIPAGAQDASGEDFTWLAGRWQVLYVDALLGEVRGTACVLPDTVPSGDLDPRSIHVRLQDPETYDWAHLYGRTLAIDGDELVLELGGRSPSKARRSGEPALFRKLQRGMPAGSGLSNVLRAPVDGELTLSFGETTRAVAVDRGVRESVAASVTLRLRRTPDRRALQGSWSTPFDARDGMGGRRVGTREGTEVVGQEAWVKDHEPIDDVRVRMLDYRSNRERGARDQHARWNAERFPGLTAGTVELEVPLRGSDAIKVWFQDERILLDSAQVLDEDTVLVTALLSEDVEPNRKVFTVDNVPVRWTLEYPDRPVDAKEHPECANFLGDFHCGRKRAPEASFQRYLFDGKLPPPVTWQATRVLAVGELFDISLTQPVEPFYRTRSILVRTPRATYGPYVAERSSEHSNVFLLPVFFHAGPLPADAGDPPANLIPVDVRPGEEVLVVPADAPEGGAHHWGRLVLLPPQSPGWNDALRRAAAANEGVDADALEVEWDALRGSFRPQQRTGAVVGEKSNWIFTHWLFALAERPLFLVNPVTSFVLEGGLPDGPAVTITIPVTLADQAGLLLVLAELERTLTDTEARLQFLERRIRANPGAGLELLANEFPYALENMGQLSVMTDIPARVQGLRESVAEALEDVRGTSATDVDELLKIGSLATREILQRTANRLVRPTDPTRGEPSLPAVIPDRQARAVVLSLDTLCDAARKQGEYASLDTSVCLSLVSIATAGISITGGTTAFVGEVLVASEATEIGAVLYNGGSSIRVIGSYAGFLADAGSVLIDTIMFAELQGDVDLEYGIGMATGDFDIYWANRRARTMQVIVGAPSMVGLISQAISFRTGGLPTLRALDAPVGPPGRLADWIGGKLERLRGLRRWGRSGQASREALRVAARELDAVDSALAAAARRLADELGEELDTAAHAADQFRVLEDAERMLEGQRVLADELQQLADELTLRAAKGRSLAQRRAHLARRDVQFADEYVDSLAERLGLERAGAEPPRDVLGEAPGDVLGEAPGVRPLDERVIAISLEELAEAAGDESLALRARGQAEFHAQRAELESDAIPTALSPEREREVAAWLRAVAPFLESPEEVRYALEGARWYDQHASLALAGVEDLPDAPPAALPELLRRSAGEAEAELRALREHLGVRAAELEEGWRDIDTTSQRVLGDSAPTVGVDELEQLAKRLEAHLAEVEALRARAESVSAQAADQLARASNDMTPEPARAETRSTRPDDARLRGYRNDIDLPPRSPRGPPSSTRPTERTPIAWFEAEVRRPSGVTRSPSQPRNASPATETLRTEIEASAATLTGRRSSTETQLSVARTLEDLEQESAALLPAPEVRELPRPPVRPEVDPRADGSYYARWPVAPEGMPVVILTDLGHRIDVSDVYRRGMEPAGCAGVMISDSLNEVGLFAPKRIRITNIKIDQPTLAQLADGLPAGETLLGRTLSNTVLDLGGEPVRWDFGLRGDKSWIEVEIDY